MLLRLIPYGILLGILFAAWLGSQDKIPTASFDVHNLPRQPQEDEARRCSDIALGQLSIKSQEDGQTIARKAFEKCKIKWNLAADAAREHIGSIIRNKNGHNTSSLKTITRPEINREEILSTYRDAYSKSSLEAVQDLQDFSNNPRASKP
jgi:hypothetical protein